MPFQLITRAVCSAPTWPMPQLRVPTPIRPCATPSNSRPTINMPRLSNGRLCTSVAMNVSTPLSRIPLRPSTIARLVPTLSDMRPAMGRLSSVARYCEPMVIPATTALKPSSPWT